LPSSSFAPRPRRASPSLAVAATALASALFAAACSCPQTKVLVDDFEGCTGACGWALSVPGTAVVVSTILPGEHGLQMDGGITAIKTISATTIDTTYSLQLVADCPEGLTATLAATEPDSSALTLPVTLSIDETLTSSSDTPDYTGVSYVPLVGVIDLPTGVMSVIVHQVALQPAAGASCTVDTIELTSARPCSG
jgi:hypothetical protein